MVQYSSVLAVEVLSHNTCFFLYRNRRKYRNSRTAASPLCLEVSKDRGRPKVEANLGIGGRGSFQTVKLQRPNPADVAPA